MTGYCGGHESRIGTIVALVALYYLLPFDRWSDQVIGLELVAGIVVLAAMVVWQTRAIG